MLAIDPALPAQILEAEEDEDTLEDWEEMITSILVSILLNFCVCTCLGQRHVLIKHTVICPR